MLPALLPSMKQNGFTLIELMIVIAMIAILAAIAIPQYHDFTIKARRTEGFSFLQGIKLAEISYYTDNNVYTSNQYNIWIIGAIDKIPKYYLGGIGRPPLELYVSNPVSGYVAALYGNLDSDLTLDMLILVAGAPQSGAPGYVDGMHVVVDDRFF